MPSQRLGDSLMRLDLSWSRSRIYAAGTLLLALLAHYLGRLVYRRHARQLQDGIQVLIEGRDVEIEYVQAPGHNPTQVVADILSPSIVAVHGLGAHPEYTWTAKPERAPSFQESTTCGTSQAWSNRRVNWLKDEGFLKSDFENARIMTFGYNADWLLRPPMATAEQRARTLLRELKRKRQGPQVHAQPLIMVLRTYRSLE